MPRQVMREGQSAEGAPQADMGKFHDTNTPGSLRNDSTTSCFFHTVIHYVLLFLQNYCWRLIFWHPRLYSLLAIIPGQERLDSGKALCRFRHALYGTLPSPIKYRMVARSG